MARRPTGSYRNPEESPLCVPGTNLPEKTIVNGTAVLMDSDVGICGDFVFRQAEVMQ
jgi:hypothetical protein